jgi:hypothetical protein
MDAVAGGLRGAASNVHQRILLPQILAGRTVSWSARSITHGHLCSASASHRLPRVEVTPTGVDLQHFHRARNGTCTSLGGTAETPLLIFVSALDPAHHFKGSRSCSSPSRARRFEMASRRRRRRLEQTPCVNLARAAGLAERVHSRAMSATPIFPVTTAPPTFMCFLHRVRGSVWTGVSRGGGHGDSDDRVITPGVRTVVLDDETGCHVAPC